MADVAGKRSAPIAADESTAELVQRAADQISRLMRDELALARIELAEKGKQAGIGIGLFGGSGALVFYAIGTLIAALVLLLAEVLIPWVAALIVGVALLLLAGTLALLGRRQVRRMGSLVPESAAASVRADVEAVKDAVRRNGRAVSERSEAAL
ncbi:MAG TPA: phage holin family protein [Pilimelia sp.]|nr:phage holin family protein [Pilimelia sp.]